MIETLRRHRGPVALVVLLVVATAIYWLSAHEFDAGRPDLFYLADAFLHGRLWLERALGPYDVIIVGDRVFVPFAPFPAIALMPLVAVFGPDVVTQWQPLVNAVLAAAGLGACWWMLARIGVRSIARPPVARARSGASARRSGSRPPAAACGTPGTWSPRS